MSFSKQALIESGARLLQLVWVGSLLTIGYLAAPVLFQSLERQLAGQVAGQLFAVEAVIGLVCGPLLLLDLWLALRGRMLRHWRCWVLLLMLALVAVGYFVLQPMMQELKAAGITPGSDTAARFARLHGVSSILYLLTSLGGLALVVLPAAARARLRQE